MEDHTMLTHEFPDFPPADVPAIPAGFRATHWHNDMCPTWEHPTGLRLLVDYANPTLRELPDDDGRFVLTATATDAELLVTDDWSEMERFIATLALASKSGE